MSSSLEPGGLGLASQKCESASMPLYTVFPSGSTSFLLCLFAALRFPEYEVKKLNQASAWLCLLTALKKTMPWCEIADCLLTDLRPCPLMSASVLRVSQGTPLAPSLLCVHVACWEIPLLSCQTVCYLGLISVWNEKYS